MRGLKSGGMGGHFLLGLIFCFGLFSATSLKAQDAPDQHAALAWLISQQREDGGWSDGFSSASGAGSTTEALLALVVSEYDLGALPADPLRYLSTQINQNSRQLPIGVLARVVILTQALGEDARRFGGVDLINTINERYNPETGLIGGSMYEHCLAVDALGEDAPPDAYLAIIGAVNPDGGWGFAPDQASDSNTTATCLMALAKTDALNRELEQAALAYLRDLQNEDGGWPFNRSDTFTNATESYSTALVLEALQALNQDLSMWGEPINALATLQMADGGLLYSTSFAPDDGLRVFGTAASLRVLATYP